MDVLITVKVDQADALQTIMDLQELGYTLAAFDVGSVVVPMPKKKITRTMKGPKWPGHTRLRLVRIPQAAKVRSGAVVVPVLKELGVGWEGTYDELKDAMRERMPGVVDSSIRAYGGYAKNAGCLEVLS